MKLIPNFNVLEENTLFRCSWHKNSGLMSNPNLHRKSFFEKKHNSCGIVFQNWPSYIPYSKYKTSTLSKITEA